MNDQTKCGVCGGHMPDGGKHQGCLLHAAAPELLEACKDLLEHFKTEAKDNNMEIRNKERFYMAEQVIAKAEGK